MAEHSEHQPAQEADSESNPQVAEAHSPREIVVPEAVQTSDDPQIAEQHKQASVPAESGSSPQAGLPTEPTDPSSNPQNHAPLQIDEDVQIPSYSISKSV